MTAVGVETEAWYILGVVGSKYSGPQYSYKLVFPHFKMLNKRMC